MKTLLFAALIVLLSAVGTESFSISGQSFSKYHGCSSVSIIEGNGRTAMRTQAPTSRMTLFMDGSDDSDIQDDDDEAETAATPITPEFSSSSFVEFPVRTSEPDPDTTWRTLGLDRAAIIMPIVLLINVWFFTIPPEFRRTRLCSEMDTAAYPEVCMTPKMFVNGIADYYKQGGGIQWDFSIAQDNPFVAPKSTDETSD